MNPARFRNSSKMLRSGAAALPLALGCATTNEPDTADTSSSSSSSTGISEESSSDAASEESAGSSEDASSSSSSEGSSSSESSSDSAESSTTTTSSTTTSSDGSGEASGEDPGDTNLAEGSSESGGTGGEFVMTSPAFEDQEGCGPNTPEPCDIFEARNVHTMIGGENVSPELNWENAPAGTLSYAIAFHDLSNLGFGGGASDDPFTHWVMWNIPGDYTSLPEGLPSGSMPAGLGPDTQQASFGGDDGYAGSGARGKVYEFVLYALDVEVFTPSNTNSQDAVQSELDASGAVLGVARMRGRSEPPPDPE